MRTFFQDRVLAERHRQLDAAEAERVANAKAKDAEFWRETRHSLKWFVIIVLVVGTVTRAGFVLYQMHEAQEHIWRTHPQDLYWPHPWSSFAPRQLEAFMRTDASFSEDRRFRYWLLREWDPSLPKVAFIGLNPSIADENTDDPTIRRCLGFARAWGKGGLVMLNLYAFRTTYPKFLWAERKKGTDIIGGQRNWVERLQGYCEAFSCDLVIAAWGSDGKRRQDDVVPRWPSLMCLGVNADGTPKHPLYLKADLVPVPLR